MNASDKHMQKMLNTILLVGIFIASALVLIGGVLYLYQHGTENLQIELLVNTTQINIQHIWHNIFSPLGIIALGLMILVFTQILRVALITVFYTYARDYIFASMSVFILLVLVYGFVFRN